MQSVKDNFLFRIFISVPYIVNNQLDVGELLLCQPADFQIFAAVQFEQIVGADGKEM